MIPRTARGAGGGRRVRRGLGAAGGRSRRLATGPADARLLLRLLRSRPTSPGWPWTPPASSPGGGAAGAAAVRRRVRHRVERRRDRARRRAVARCPAAASSASPSSCSVSAWCARGERAGRGRQPLSRSGPADRAGVSRCWSPAPPPSPPGPRRRAAPLLAAAAGLGFAGVGIAARALQRPTAWWRLLAEPLLWALVVGGVIALAAYAAALQRGARHRGRGGDVRGRDDRPGGRRLHVLGDRARPGFLAGGGGRAAPHPRRRDRPGPVQRAGGTPAVTVG